MNQRISVLSLFLMLVSFGPSQSTAAQKEKGSPRQAEDPLFQSIRALAEAPETEAPVASTEIDGIISAVDDSEALFNLVVKLRQREMLNGKKHDGTCHMCLRYFGAYISAMHTLSKLNTDEAAQHLVRLMTVKSCDWQGMPMKELLYSISLMGKRTLPYLEALRGKHPLADMIIEVVQKGDLFW